MSDLYVARLVQYGIESGLIPEEERIYSTNQILEVMKKEPMIVIDGAHNIQGIKALRKNVEKYFKYKNIYLLLGILADKQVKEMIEEITPIAKKVYALDRKSVV